MKKTIHASEEAKRNPIPVTSNRGIMDEIEKELLRQVSEKGLSWGVDPETGEEPDTVAIADYIMNYPEAEEGNYPAAVGLWIEDTQMNYPSFFACESVLGAEDDSATGGYDDSVDNLKADFDYVIEGLDKMSRMGGAKEKEALALVLEFSASVTNMINSVAGSVTE